MPRPTAQIVARRFATVCQDQVAPLQVPSRLVVTRVVLRSKHVRRYVPLHLPRPFKIANL